jgi:hypothetical protein
MIKINLLPTEPGKRPAAAAARKVAGPSAVPYYLGLLIVYGVAIVLGLFFWNQVRMVQNTATSLVKERDKKKAEVQAREKEFEEQNLKSREIEERYAVVEALGPQNRIFWSEKINMVAKSRLNLAVYITKMELTERVEEVETDESIQRRKKWQEENKKTPNKTPEPPAVKQPVVYQALIINAIAYGTDSPQRLRQVTAFSENLRGLEWPRDNGQVAKFVDRLSPDFEPLPQKLDRVAGVEVLRFGIKINAHPQKAQTGPKPPAAAGTDAAAAPAAAKGGK